MNKAISLASELFKAIGKYKQASFNLPFASERTQQAAGG